MAITCNNCPVTTCPCYDGQKAARKALFLAEDALKTFEDRYPPGSDRPASWWEQHDTLSLAVVAAEKAYNEVI